MVFSLFLSKRNPGFHSIFIQGSNWTSNISVETLHLWLSSDIELEQLLSLLWPHHRKPANCSLEPGLRRHLVSFWPELNFESSTNFCFALQLTIPVKQSAIMNVTTLNTPELFLVALTKLAGEILKTKTYWIKCRNRGRKISRLYCLQSTR